MRSWSASCIALTALTLSLARPATAEASPSSQPATTVTTTESPPAEPDARRRPNRVRAVELHGVAMGQLLPRPGFGGDLAFTFGFTNFQARVGALVVGVPAFRLGQGELGNVLQVGTLDLCAAKPVLRHQIRMCVGSQAGGMSHRWKGYGRPGRRFTPWVAGTLKGDYQIALTDHFSAIGAVGVVVPVVGPSFLGRSATGSPSPLVFPGPMAGFVSLGTSYRW